MRVRAPALLLLRAVAVVLPPLPDLVCALQKVFVLRHDLRVNGLVRIIEALGFSLSHTDTQCVRQKQSRRALASAAVAVPV